MQRSTAPCEVAIVAGDLVKTGGMDRANYALADYLTRSGHSLSVVAHRVSSELLERPAVRFHRVPKPLHSYLLGEPLLDGRGRMVARSVNGRGGIALVNGGNCVAGPVNWVHYVHAAYRPRRAANRRALVRSAYHHIARRRELAAFARARLVIANSAATRRVLVERLGVKPDAAVVVYYGIDAAQFASRTPGRAAEVRQELGWPERPTWAFVGALGDERKGFDTLFDAWRALCKKPSWDANLVAIGGGSDVEVWRARARAEGLGDRVQLLGFRGDVHRLLAACDGLVAPTRYEAFGLGVAEALAVGLPAIVSADAGVAELYPSDLGSLLLGDPESASELARKLEAWREAPAERTRLVEGLSERVRGRTWDHMAEDIVPFMAERIESHAR